jgi:hypothetical protein
MASYSELKRKYEPLHRFLTGITVTCLVVTILGSGIAGVSVWEIGMRGALVIFALMIANRIIIQLWSSWEEVQYTSKVGSSRSRRKR